MPSNPDDGITNRQRLDWWRQARFGMFIHWRPVSLKGTEIGWSRGDEVPIDEYDQLYTRFNPIKFDADAWIATAKAAGMKYVVFTTKHHDGFCMWDTEETDYNIMHSPFARDIVGELSEACQRAGIRFCTYYSVCDWHHPDFPLTSPGGRVRRERSHLDRYEAYLRAQVRELITKYGPLGVMWYDVPQEFDQARGEALIDYTRSLQPDIIINDRSGRGTPGDYDTPEQRVGTYQFDRPWETCMTIARQWAWKPDDDTKSLRECLQALVLSAAGDGNLLFNVGPTPEGLIEPHQVGRLKQMGSWLERNGESIYGTRGGPWKPSKSVASTRVGNTIFLHVLRPDENTIALPGLPVAVESARLLDRGTPVEVRQHDGTLIITLPDDSLDPIDTVVQLELGTPALDIAAIDLPPEISASASSTATADDERFDPTLAFDGDPHTRWAPADSGRPSWIAARFATPRTIHRVRILEPGPPCAERFELQCRQGGAWKTIFSGTTIGAWFQQRFDPVTASEFRLHILEASDGLKIADIEFFEP